MKGIELSKAFFNQYGLPMLKTEFIDILPLLAVGFVGSGSERYGFDDELSTDHDFDVGFSIFLPDESLIDGKTEFKLERAYSKLPKEFMGYKRQNILPVGGNRNGPVRTADFYFDKVGSKNGELTLEKWLTLPDYTLFEATDGEVFYDGFGEFTAIRNNLKNIPEDVRLKRIAGNLLIMAQSGQYNYMRSVKREQLEASVFAINEFVNACIKTLFLLKGKFAPYYKWSFYALQKIEEKSLLNNLSAIILSDKRNDVSALIEKISNQVIDRLKLQGITTDNSCDLERHAYSVNDKIKDGNIRNLNILVSV